MTSAQAGIVLQYIRRIASRRRTAELPDAQLLERFTAQRDEAAFAALMRRHGPMVLNVCRSVLHHQQDAEDSFQATFLVLARKATAIRRPEAVAGWLCEVAYHVALKAQADAARRRAQERKATPMLPADPTQDLTLRDLRRVLHEELLRLPEKYRLPLVLCYLEGRSQEDAAGQLGWSKSTLRGRLNRGREHLRRRLAARGMVLSAVLCATAVAPGTAADALIGATARMAVLATVDAAGSGAVSAKVMALAEGAIKTLFTTKLKTLTVLLLAASLVAGTAGVLTHQVLTTAKSPDESQQSQIRGGKRESESGNKHLQAIAEEKPQVNRDRYGDPLPPGAIARLGTVRFRMSAEAQGLAFASDGKTVAVSSRGGLFLFNADSGKWVKRLGDFTSTYRPENAVVFSPDGKSLAARGHVVSRGEATRYKSVVRVWELAGDEKPRMYDAEHLIWIGWSSQGEPLAVCLEKDGVWLRELRSGRSRYFECPNLGRSDPFGPDHRLCACAPAGLLAAPDMQGVLHVWETTTGKKRFTLEPDKDGSLHGLDFSSDGRHLAVMKQGRAPTYLYAVVILDAATGRILRTVATGHRYLTALTFSPDGKTLATAGWKGIHFWDVGSGRELGRIQGEATNTTMIAFSGDGQSLATLKTHLGVFQVWAVATGKRKSEPVGHHTDSPLGTAFSPDGRRVASGGGMDGTIHVWELASSKSLLSIHRPGLWVRDVAWSRDGRWLYSTWDDDQLWISDAATGERKHLIKLEDPERSDTRQEAISMHLSADGKTLVAFSYYRKKSGGPNYQTLITGWDPSTRKQLFRRGQPWLPELTTSEDARLLAVAFSRERDMEPGKGPLRLEDLATGEPLLMFPTLEGQTWPLRFSPDSRLLAACNYNYERLKKDKPTSTASSLVLSEVATASEVLSLPLAGQPTAAFSPDGRLLAIPAPSRSILVWDLAQGSERRRFQEFDGEVTWLAFSPDGRRLISGHADSTLLVWQVPAPPPGRKDKLGPESLARAWADLAGADAPRAFRARWTLASAPEAALPLLAKHLHPAQPADPKRLGQLLADLDSAQFAVRAVAQKGLEELGELATPALRQMLANKPSLELRRRGEGLLVKLRGPVTEPERRRAARAVAVLEDVASPETRELLATLAQGAPEARLTQEARAALRPAFADRALIVLKFDEV